MPRSPPLMPIPNPPPPAATWILLRPIVSRVASVKTEPPTVGLTVESLNEKPADPVRVPKTSRLASVPLSDSPPAVAVIASEVVGGGDRFRARVHRGAERRLPVQRRGQVALGVRPSCLIDGYRHILHGRGDVSSQVQAARQIAGGHGNPVPAIRAGRRLGGLQDGDSQVAARDRHAEHARSGRRGQSTQPDRDQRRTRERGPTHGRIDGRLAQDEVGRAGEDALDIEARQ